jgi:hypothetical protein
MKVNMKAENFDGLTPDVIINEVEQAIQKPMSGLAAPLPSYINRVYELQTADGERVIAKFYRPGRWTRAAIEEEHRFVLDCAEDDIPVIALFLRYFLKDLGVKSKLLMTKAGNVLAWLSRGCIWLVPGRKRRKGLCLIRGRQPRLNWNIY